MHPPEITTTCPSCTERISVDDPSPASEPLRPWWDASATTAEIECPVCGWEFAVNEQGRVTDDGGLDPVGPFEVGPEGELASEILLPATCPACGRRFEVGEAGVTQCPGCRHRFEVDDAPPPEPPGAVEQEGDKDGFPEEEFLCPTCGSDGDLDSVGFLALDGGWVVCQECGWEFCCLSLFQDVIAWQREERNVRKEAGQRRLVVAADGSGDCTCMARAVEKVTDGTVILIRPGIYAMPLALALRRLTLQGDGPAEAIRLTGGLEVVGSRLRLRGLTLTRTIQAHRSRLRLVDCTLRGAEQAGLEATGPGSDLRLQTCRIEECKAFGVRATPGTVVRLSRCTLANNAEGGIQVEDGAWARLRECRLLANGGDGVRAGPHSSVFLHRCVLTDNEGPGIALYGGRALVTGSQILNHTGTGILLGRHGCLLMRRCEVGQGRGNGMVFERRSRAIASDCAITDNRLGGLWIGTRSRVALARCSIRGNGVAGVHLAASGRLGLRQCVCEANRGGDWVVEPGGCLHVGP